MGEPWGSGRGTMYRAYEGFLHVTRPDLNPTSERREVGVQLLSLPASVPASASFKVCMRTFMALAVLR